MSHYDYTYVGCYIWFEKIKNIKSREVFGCQNCKTANYLQSTYCKDCGRLQKTYMEEYNRGFDFYEFDGNDTFMHPEYVNGNLVRFEILMSNSSDDRLTINLQDGLSIDVDNEICKFEKKFKKHLNKLKNMNIKYHIRFGIINYQM